MAPGRKRGAKGLKSNNELSLGDLVLAKVKGFPAWPAKISRPEDWKRAPDAKKYFVQFFGTSEIAFVAPADIQVFTSEAKSKLSARCRNKKVKFFAQAVTEICEEFELLQRQSASGLRGDNNTPDFASRHYADPIEDETFEGAGNDDIGSEGPVIKSEIRSHGGMGSQSLGEAESQDSKDYASEDMDSLSPQSSSQKTNMLSVDPENLVEKAAAPSRNGEPSRGTEIEGGCSDGGPKELATSHQSTQGMGQKRKRDGTIHKNGGLALSQERKKDGVDTKFASDCSIKDSSVDLVLGLAVSSRRNKKLLKEKLQSDGAVDILTDAKGKAVGKDQNISRKNEKPLHGHENCTVETCSPKTSRRVHSADGSNIMRNQTSGKIDAKAPLILDKIKNIPSKRFRSGGEAENPLTSKVQTNDNEPGDSSDEDDLPLEKRHHKLLDRMSTTASLNENKLGNVASRMNGLVHPNRGRSPVTQLPAKRRAVRLYEDEEDEHPKTPIHGGVVNNVSVTPYQSNSKKQTVSRGENYLHDQQRVFRNLGTVNDTLRKQAQPIRAFNKALSSTTRESMEKVTGTSTEHSSPSARRLASDRFAALDAKSIIVSPKGSPQSMRTMLSSELQSQNSSKAPGDTDFIVQKKVVEGVNKGALSASDQSSSFFSQPMSEKSKVASSGEKRKTTPKIDSLIKDESIPGNSDAIVASPGLRRDVGKTDKMNFPVMSKNPESDVSMKNLIAAAAKARKRQAYLLNSSRNPFPFLAPDAELTGGTSSPNIPVVSINSLRVDARPTSPTSDTRQVSLINQHGNDEFEERGMGSAHQASGSPLSGGTDAAVARDAFEGMIETLSRTKESIGRATRHAIDCANYGIANEVVELLIRKLESEASLHRRVDLFFLVDSITQCSHSQKGGIAGASYIPAVQAALPRIIASAAPPGAGAQENRRQCHKVLRLWLERKIMPEFILRHHINDIGATNDDASAGFSFRRPSRAERAFDDPIREMEGMLVDEYGSNATFQLPGLMTSHIFDEEEEDEGNLPTNLSSEMADTPPSQQTPASQDTENHTVAPNDRRCLVLEDVDGELEMEDVSGHHHGTSSFSNSPLILESLPSPECSPPLPFDTPPETPPLPSSPCPFSQPPQPLPLPLVSSPPPPPPSSQQHLHPLPPIGPPLFISVPPHPPLISQHRPPLANTLAHPQPFPYPPPPLLHEVGSAPSENQLHRGEVFSQQAPFPTPAAVSIPRERAFYNSSRPVEYGQVDSYGNFQALPPWQPYHTGGAPFAQRPLRPNPSTRLPYPNDALQHQHPPYSLPNFPNGPRGHPYHHEGYFGIPQEIRPLAIAVNFHPSASKIGSSASASSDHGVHMMASRPDMSNGHWRPT